jgi:hypothetical protein
MFSAPTPEQYMSIDIIFDPTPFTLGNTYKVCTLAFCLRTQASWRIVGVRHAAGVLPEVSVGITLRLCC